jgi:hypothetical protein
MLEKLSQELFLELQAMRELQVCSPYAFTPAKPVHFINSATIVVYTAWSSLL